MAKFDSWVVIRLEEEVTTPDELISIKGVYDSEEAAEKAVYQARRDSPSGRYVVMRSRRFADRPSTTVLKPPAMRSQGFDLNEPAKFEVQETFDVVKKIQGMLSDAPPAVVRQTLQPILHFFAERRVAKALRATKLRQKDGPDISLPDGNNHRSESGISKRRRTSSTYRAAAS
jgi:hypothetical protein